VSDTGGGISPEVAERLFEPFFTTKPQGTGLGLSITRQIIEEHGGELTWRNREGGGTTFVVRLPIKRPAGRV
jgi:signal transduction histidine kinase